MSKVERGPANDSCDTTGDNGMDPALEGRDGVANRIQLSPGKCRDRMCSGGSVSNGDSGPTSEDQDGSGDDGRSPATNGRDVACGDGTPHVSAACSGKSTEQQRGRPAERMVSLSVRGVGSAGPPWSAPDSQNRALRALRMSGRAWMRQTRRGVGIPPNMISVVDGMTRMEVRGGVEGEV